jgi:hypothetical protein
MCGVTADGLTVRGHHKLPHSSRSEVSGIAGVAVKCVETGRNAKWEAS